jgi:catechol 2,3-dioxygenase-like lactoylglutathione lyase family enzyme
MITGYDHVQIAIPAGGEDLARAFYAELLDMQEATNPPALAARGGCWFHAGAAQLHLGVADPFTPARKAHPAFLVTDLDHTRAVLESAGYDCVDGSGEVPGVRRIHTFDPFGNRLEFQQR